MIAENSNYSERVQQGKQVEFAIIESLRVRGLNLVHSSEQEDKQMKVDAWIVDKHSVKHSLQIKFRESGSDIIFEVIKDIDKRIDGRDLESQAEYYFVLDRRNTGRLYLTAPIKARAVSVKQLVVKELSVNPALNFWKGNGWEARIHNDRGSKERKLMTFFRSSSFHSIAEWSNMLL